LNHAHKDLLEVIQDLKGSLILQKAMGVEWLPLSPMENEESPKPDSKLPGIGNGASGLCFIRICPSNEEMEKGEPFSDSGGKLVYKMIQALKLDSDSVYLTYFFKQPAGQIDDEPSRISDQINLLLDELEPLGLKVLVTMGERLSQWLSNLDQPIEELRQTKMTFGGQTLLLPSWDPLVLIRMPKFKKPVWEDLQRIQPLLKG